jgi:ureidoacrylate peracid hydrolase
MHKSEVPQYAVDAVMKRRGKPYVFDEIDPVRTALVVIDMQNIFLQEGAPAETPMAREIVPNINRLAESTRETGGAVAWIQMVQAEEDLQNWSVFFEEIFPAERVPGYYEWLKEGSKGHELWPELDVWDGDLIMNKNRYSAFLPGASELAETLAGQDIDTVLITGTVTNVCCESSARDAMMRNFKTIMVGDANGAKLEESHLASLANFSQVFGDVRSTDDVIGLLRAGISPVKQATAAE